MRSTAQVPSCWLPEGTGYGPAVPAPDRREVLLWSTPATPHLAAPCLHMSHSIEWSGPAGGLGAQGLPWSSCPFPVPYVVERRHSKRSLTQLPRVRDCPLLLQFTSRHNVVDLQGTSPAYWEPLVTCGYRSTSLQIYHQIRLLW